MQGSPQRFSFELSCRNKNSLAAKSNTGVAPFPVTPGQEEVLSPVPGIVRLVLPGERPVGFRDLADELIRGGQGFVQILDSPGRE